ncbi:hypothetical protein [Legionella maioricensis]|uniref:Pili assembly chaperone N-terminal domain-containing protein n=1 Tax=Legionella maioricensis TaxID=2896528 RepID=A0A9X2CXQ0_9GAMM|nr:hypothetical protein [Legionella maioricensis]MCL9682779.1 hypothetical protein [Legionella maioricensis]MCL9686593.1 hypothetical protein [Legionella maioricensis]
MKIIMACLLQLLVASAGFAENILINNETTFPIKKQKSKLVIQWAASAKEIQEANKAIIYGLKLDPSSLQIISKAGENILNIPKNAAHFRLLAWSKDAEMPDLLTSWVDVVPNKSYKLQKDQLVLAVLMSGAGC